jgi:hypothetical protein
MHYGITNLKYPLILYKHIIYLPLTHHLFQHHVSSFHNHPHPHKTKEERLSKQITVPLL